MTPRESELRWERVWNFVLVDALLMFSRELMIPPGLEKSLPELRSVLSEHYVREEYGESSALLHIALVTAMRRIFGTQYADGFLLWCENFCTLYNDRTEEFFWNSALYGVNEVECEKWIHEDFDAMTAKMKIAMEVLSQRLATLQSGLSDWDIRTLNRMEMSIDTFIVNVRLTCTYNLFADIWRTAGAHFTVEQLSDIYRYGKALARKRNIVETVVSFPGVWDYTAGRMGSTGL